jgi:hypothetical protein
LIPLEPGRADVAAGMPVPAAIHHRRWRPLSVLSDAMGILSVAFVFPLVILAIGIPVALLVRLLMWLVGAR